MPLSILPDHWTERFRGLAGLPLNQGSASLTGLFLSKLAQSRKSLAQGYGLEHILLLIEGRIRVQQVSEQGEIVLYRWEAAKAVTTTACLLAYEDYMAQGIADGRAACWDPEGFLEELLATSEAFRHFVFLAYSKRMTDLFHELMKSRLSGLIFDWQDCSFGWQIVSTAQLL